jgi:repressor LexA
MPSKPTLTYRQKQILDYIKEKISQSGYPPSVREIGQAVGLRSSSTVYNHLLQLEQKGYLKKDPTKPRAIIPVDGDSELQKSESIFLPVVGNVAAGSHQYWPNKTSKNIFHCRLNSLVAAATSYYG